MATIYPPRRQVDDPRQPLAIELVPMRRRHIPQVLDIERQVYPRPWTMTLFLSEIVQRSTRFYIVAKARRQVVGYAGLMVFGDEAHVTNIAVDPAAHRRKVASRLLFALVTEARRRGATACTLEVRVANHAAQGLYQFGFAPVGIRKNYYAETGEDALIMWPRASRPRPTPSAWPAWPPASPSPGSCSGAGARDRDLLRRDRRRPGLRRPPGPLQRARRPADPARPLRRGGARGRLAGPRRPAPPGRRAGLRPRRARLGDVDAVAVTIGPGLAGSLLVGVAAAKAYALALDRPLVGVNHLIAHVYANVLDHGTLPLPAVVFVVSGGHTSLLAMDEQGAFRGLGQTIDDAAGEAYDKVARVLGLGYPGGPVVDRLARDGDPAAVRFPRALLDDGTDDFSFSGLKTAVLRHVRAAGPDVNVADVAASFQEAVVDVQISKVVGVAKREGLDTILLGGAWPPTRACGPAWPPRPRTSASAC